MSQLEVKTMCSRDACNNRFYAENLVGGYQNLTGEITGEIAICDGTPCMLTTDFGRNAVSHLLERVTGIHSTEGAQNAT